MATTSEEELKRIEENLKGGLWMSPDSAGARQRLGDSNESIRLHQSLQRSIAEGRKTKSDEEAVFLETQLAAQAGNKTRNYGEEFIEAFFASDFYKKNEDKKTKQDTVLETKEIPPMPSSLISDEERRKMIISPAFFFHYNFLDSLHCLRHNDNTTPQLSEVALAFERGHIVKRNINAALIVMLLMGMPELIQMAKRIISELVLTETVEENIDISTTISILTNFNQYQMLIQLYRVERFGSYEICKAAELAREVHEHLEAHKQGRCATEIFSCQSDICQNHRSLSTEEYRLLAFQYQPYKSVIETKKLVAEFTENERVASIITNYAISTSSLNPK